MIKIFTLSILLINGLTLSTDISLKIEIRNSSYIRFETIPIDYILENSSEFFYIYTKLHGIAVNEDGKEFQLWARVLDLKLRPSYPILKPKEKIKSTVRNCSSFSSCLPVGRYKVYLYINKGGEYFDNYNESNSRLLNEKVFSNTIEIEVKEPEGINKEAYERFLKIYEIRMKATDVQNPLFWELLEKYPESLYAEKLAVKKILGYDPLFQSSGREWKHVECKVCKGFKERSRAYLEKEEAYRGQMEYIKKEKKKRDILEKVILAHKESKYVIPLMYRLAYKCLELEDYDKGRFYYQEIIKLESKETPKQLKPFIESAKEYLRCLDEYGLK